MNFIDSPSCVLQYIICLLVLIPLNPCFSETKRLSNTEDSPESKPQEKLSIYTNWDLYKRQEIQGALDYLKTEDHIKKQMEIYDHLSEEDKAKAIDKNNRILYGKWKAILADPKYNDYVKDSFQKAGFALWIAQSPEPLFFAIHFGNIEMVRFFSKPKGIFERFMEKYKYSPWGMAIIFQNMEMIKLYLDDYPEDVKKKDSQHLNLFHYIFLGATAETENRDYKKDQISELLFGERYFLNISHLLNEVNDTDSTAFDYFLRDDFIGGKNQTKIIMDKFLYNGAVPVQLAHIFLGEKLEEDDLDREMRDEIYIRKGIVRIHYEKENGETIKKIFYTGKGKKIKEKIIANIKSYHCKKAVSNGSTQKTHSSRNGTLRNGSLQGVTRL